MTTGASGKYRLDQRLGGGGMAEVFLGSTIGAEGFSRRVAIKRVLTGLSDNAAFAQMFVDEAQLSSQLVHPNIVSVLDFDRDPEGRLFLVMELVEGKDLDALLATGVLPVALVIYVVAEILRGLGYAHDLPVGTHVRGVVHRDVSPHNVLLSWEGAVKVSDFGIAKVRAASAATASIFIKGKPAYMSPEQANGQPLDGRSDLFAVGIMLWEMVTGRRLFVGDDTRSTLAAVLFGQILRPRALRPELPRDLERVTMKLLERDLPARYATAEEAIAELLECADAPRAGRELLSATLAERFAGEAPVRQNRHRARSAAESRTPPGGAPTLAAGLAGVAAPPVEAATPAPAPAPGGPSLGGVRNAPTQAGSGPEADPEDGPEADPEAAPEDDPEASAAPEGPARRRTGKLALAGAVMIGAAAVSFAVISAVASGDGGGGGPTSPTSPTEPAAPTAEARTSGAAPRRPTAPLEYGKIHVPGMPSLAVYWRGRKIGESPCTLELPVGTHTITLKKQSPEIDYTDRTVSVTITAHEITPVPR